LNTKGQEKVSGKALFDEVYEKGSLIPYQIILESMQQSNIRTMDRVNGGSDGGLNEREQVDGRNSTIKEGSPKLFMDNYGRNHNYVRISLTDRCNLRCTYCMPEDGIQLTRKEKLLNDPEILRVVEVLNSQLPPSSMKVRLTGGEPLLHPSLPSLLSSISQGYSPQSVGITTNAILLNRRWDDIKDHLTSVNISLDTLNNEKFKGLTRRDGLSKVIKGIERTEGWDGKVKLNCVVMKGFNAGAQDFKEFLDFQKEMGHRFDVRFIEWMPFDGTSWGENFVSFETQTERIQEATGEELVKVESEDRNDTTKWYRLGGREEGGGGRIGFITSMSNNFCGTCNRIRITSDGSLKVCLFDGTEVSLRDAMRDGVGNEDLARIVRGALGNKKFKFGGAEDMMELSERVKENRHMTAIGG